MLRLPAALVALLLALTGCGGDAGDSDDEGAGGDATTTTSAAPGTATTTTTTTDEAGEAMVRCENPEGFTLEHPASWHTNGRCSQFHPEPFEDPGATDERVAAITAYIDPVPFDAVPPDDAERTPMTLDGLRAARLEYETGEDGFWPEGTPVTLYAVDLSSAGAPDDEPRTLFLDTVGTEPFDHARNREVLDRMARTLEITAAGVDAGGAGA